MARLDPDLLLRAYSVGVFPMADSRRADEVFWVEPKQRGVLPLDGFHLSRSLAKTLRQGRYATTADRAFPRIVGLCAEAVPGRPDTWINPDIEAAYAELHARGYAHSIEVWDGDPDAGDDAALVGGLYGVRLGRAFFGESMVSRMRDASKVALAHLVARLRVGGFTLLDCQFQTEHLASLGAIEIGRAAYVALLDAALGLGSSPSGTFPGLTSPADFFAIDRGPDGAEPTATVAGPVSAWRIVQALGQTSK